MVEKVALEPFIKGVPEETIPQQKLSSEPTRVRVNFLGSVSGGSTSGTITTLPADDLLEIRFMSFGMISGGGGVQQFTFRVDSAGGTIEELITFFLDHAEHGNHCVSFGKGSYLLPAGSVLKLLKTANQASSIFQIHISGFLIKKSEFAKKTNVVV